MTQKTKVVPENQSMVDEVKSKASRTIKTYEGKVRKSPEKAMLAALATGYCLQVIPLGGLIAVPIRLTALLAKPALLALGAMKAYELYQGQNRK